MTESPSNLNNRRILVTGASGYVGGRLVRQLVSQGAHVRVMVRDRKKIESLPWFGLVEVAEANANNFQEVLGALEGVHTVFYLCLLYTSDAADE